MSTQNLSGWRRKSTVGALLGAGVFLLSGCALDGDLVAYDLPEESAQYTLEVTTEGTTTKWAYHSDRPTESDVPETQPCIEEALQQPNVGECRPEPLIFLRYDLGLDLDNTVRATRANRITVTPYYQERLSEPPQVIDLQVEASFDDGQTWEEVRTRPTGDGTFRAFVRHERDAESVGLRVSATDSDGNTVVQTMPEAYGLR